MSTPVRFTLPESEIPKAWYNLSADFPEPLPPPLNPATKEPVSPGHDDGDLSREPC